MSVILEQVFQIKKDHLGLALLQDAYSYISG